MTIPTMSPAAKRIDFEGASGRELDSNHGNIRAGNADGVDSPIHRSSDCLLAHLFTMAMEIYYRVGGSAPFSATADRAWILHSRCHWTA